MITRAEMLELKEAEEDKHKKKSRKSRSRSRSPEKRPVSGAKKGHSPDKREKTSSCKNEICKQILRKAFTKMSKR